MSFRQSRALSYNRARELVRAAKLHGVHINPDRDGVITVSGPLSNKGYGEDILVAVRQVSPGSPDGQREQDRPCGDRDGSTARHEQADRARAAP